MKLTLRSLSDGEITEVADDVLTIGREEGNDLVLSDPKVSRRHAEIRRRPDGAWELTDLGSSNGTWLGEQRLSAPVRLAGGEQIRFGQTTVAAELVDSGATEISPVTPAAAAAAAAAGAAAAPDDAAAAPDEAPAAAEPPAAAPPPELEPETRPEPVAPPPPAPEPRAPEPVAAAAPPAQPPVQPPPAPPAAAPPPVPERRKSVIQRSASVIERIRLQRSLKRVTILAGAACVVAVIAVGLAVSGVFTGEDEDKPTAAEIIDQVAPSTVLVIANDEGERVGNGTGWVLDSREGLVVTNAHVVNAGTSFQVGIGAEPRREATIVGVAPCEDLAVLKVSDTSGLRTLPLGSQSAVRLGDEVVAIGFPGTASKKDDLTATTGVVSRPKTTFDLNAPDVPDYRNVIQTDTAINPGNSGGPLVNLEGRLVGVNSATGEPGKQNQNYAIGVDQVKAITDTLRRGNSIEWAGLGFDYPDPQRLEADGLPPGVLVTHAVPGTPAAEEGVGAEPALLTAVNGKAVATNLPSYCRAARGLKAGDVATLTLFEGTGSREVALRYP